MARKTSISLRRHNKLVKDLQERIQLLQQMADRASNDREQNLTTLRKTLDFTDDLSKRSGAKFRQMDAELADIKRRLAKIEPFVLSCLDAEQREIAGHLGISDVEYGIQYLRLLYANRHIIHEVRNMQ